MKNIAIINNQGNAPLLVLLWPRAKKNAVVEHESFFNYYVGGENESS